MKKFLLRTLYFILILAIVIAIFYAWPRVPIITGYVAKGMCSGVFVCFKDPEQISTEDLSFFPISLAKMKVDYDERSVTATVLGLAKRKAIYREGPGTVLVLDMTEEELLEKAFALPDPGYSQDTIPWPMGDILPDTLPAGIDYEGLQAILDAAIDPANSEPFRKSLGIAVVYDGVLIAEKYFDTYDHKTIFHGWSQAKSITNTMVGILVKEGKLDLAQTPDIPQWKDDERSKITINNLLQMNDGLHWVENYFDISEVTKMLFNSDDMYKFSIGTYLEHEPGTKWNYSGGTTNILSGLIRKTINDDEKYHRFVYAELFYRIGMLHTLFETDGSGTFVGSSYCFASTWDWARFGLLYLNDGIFTGDTILPPGWVDYTCEPAPNSHGFYGAHFWLQQKEGKYPDIPADMYFIDGFLGQRVFIIPSRDLVVVRLGYSHKNFDFNQFLSEIIKILPEKG